MQNTRRTLWDTRYYFELYSKWSDEARQANNEININGTSNLQFPARLPRGGHASKLSILSYHL